MLEGLSEPVGFLQQLLYVTVPQKDQCRKTLTPDRLNFKPVLAFPCAWEGVSGLTETVKFLLIIDPSVKPCSMREAGPFDSRTSTALAYI